MRLFAGIIGLGFAAVLLAAGLAAARTLTERERTLSREGNASYEAGDFAAAAKAYEEVLHSGIESRDLYYNLGNAYLKQGKLGPAILNYRRALALDPSDEDARSNLAYARRRTQDATPQEVADPFPWITAIRPGAERAGAIYLIALNLAAILFAGRRLIRRSPGFLGPLFGVAAALTLISGLVFFMEARAETRHQEGVVVEPVVEVKSGPGADYTVAFVVHEGTEVRLGRTAPGWIEIEVTHELKGWVSSNAVGRIE